MTQRQFFKEFLSSCQQLPTPRSHAPVFEKLKDAEVTRFSEAEALTSGAILEAVVQEGEGDDSPCNGDLVYLHFSVHRSDNTESVVYSTRPENGNTGGTPLAAIVQKSPRLPRAWEMALLGKNQSEMKKGERRILKVSPEFGFQHKDCEYHLPVDHKHQESQELTIDIQLVNWYKAEDVMSTLGVTSGYILKRVLTDGVGYENLRPPYRVDVSLTLRKLAPDGVQLKGERLFSTDDASMLVTMGDDRVPMGVQSCLGSMVQNEHAVCIFANTKTEHVDDSSSAFPSFPKELEQIEAELKVIRVIQVRDIYGDGKAMKHRIVDGKGTFPSDCPLQDCEVKVHYKLRRWVQSTSNGESPDLPSDSEWTYNSRTESSENPLSINLGCGDLPIGVESCIHLMLPGETSRLECMADLAFNNVNTRCPIPAGISVEDDIEFEVELISFQKGMQWAGISPEESLEEARNMKALANKLYKEGATRLAANKYKSIVQQLSAQREFETEEQIQEADNLTLNCFSNLASCSIQDTEYVSAIDWCNKALKMDEENAKVLLRRAKAYSLHCDFEEAERDLQEVERLDPSLKSDAQAVLLKNRQRQKAAVLKQKEQFRNFFDRS